MQAVAPVAVIAANATGVNAADIDTLAHMTNLSHWAQVMTLILQFSLMDLFYGLYSMRESPSTLQCPFRGRNRNEKRYLSLL